MKQPEAPVEMTLYQELEQDRVDKLERDAENKIDEAMEKENSK